MQAVLPRSVLFPFFPYVLVRNTTYRSVPAFSKPSFTPVIPNSGYAYPPGYEAGYLGVSEKINKDGKSPLLGYLFIVTIYKFEITASILITNIL